jgi:hypothetical protein
MAEYTQTTGPDGQTITALEWIGAISFSAGKAVITPTLGSELLTNGNMETGDPVSNWTASQGGSSDGVADERTGGAGAQSNSNVNSIADSGRLAQSIVNPAYAWVFATGWLKKVTGTTGGYLNLRDGSGTSSGSSSVVSATSWTQTYVSGRMTAANGSIRLQNNTNAIADETRYDDVSVKVLTLSSLFSTVTTSDADVIADVKPTVTAGTQAGIVLNLDSTTNPQNFVIAYSNGANIKLEKSVAGVYTADIINIGIPTGDSSGILRVIKDGTAYRVYYSNALAGTATISDAGIISNTKHGLFSTYSTNTFDNFTLWPRGSGTTKFTDAPFEELTVTRDTTTKYLGAGSAKLVAGVDATFLQSLNVGDTATYTLIGYAYTTGAAVTTADLNLYYDTAVLSTTFTDMTGGWYKLTGTLTGVASAKDYGVKVKAGKTVYLDTLSLQAGSGATIEVTFENSSSGIANHTFENNVTAVEYFGKLDGNA